MPGNVAGLDYGTRNSALFISTNELNPDRTSKRKMIGERLDHNWKPFPSYIRYDKDYQIQSVGGEAALLSSAGMDPKYIIYDVKRLIGRKYNGTPKTEEEKNEMKDFNFFRDSLLYDVAEDSSDGQINIKIGNQSFKPEDVASDFMMKMLEKAFEDESDFILSQLVVTVPAYFDGPMRLKTKLASLMAVKKLKDNPRYKERILIKDLDIDKIEDNSEIVLVEEPTAALITYCSLNKVEIDEGKYIMVIDLGAGTLDISIGSVKYQKSRVMKPGMKETKPIMDIKSIHGNNNLGGRRMDEVIQQWAENEILDHPDKYKIHEITPEIRHLLKKEVELAKIRLSESESTKIYLQNFGIEIPFTREFMEKLLGLLLDVIKKEVAASINKAKNQINNNFSQNDLALVILVGGPTKMPCIQNLFKNKLNLPVPVLEKVTFDPLLCVAEGAVLSVSSPVIGPIPYDIITGAEFFGTEILPTELIKAGTTVPYTNTVSLLIQRGTNQKEIFDNTIYFFAQDKESKKIKCISAVKVPVASGADQKTISVPVKITAFKTLKFNKAIDMPLYFGSIDLKYEITKEHLIKCSFTDPKISGKMELRLVTRDFGTKNFSRWEDVEKAAKSSSSKNIEIFNKVFEDKIEEVMKVGRQKGIHDESALRHHAELFLWEKIEDMIPPDPDEKKLLLELIQKAKNSTDGEVKLQLPGIIMKCDSIDAKTYGGLIQLRRERNKLLHLYEK